MTALSMRMLRTACLAAGVAMLAAGCASVSQVSPEASSYGSWPAGRAPGTYAFERLPSQQADGGDQDKVEASAAAALERAGFKRVEAAKDADVAIEAMARLTTVQYDPWYDSRVHFGFFAGYGRGPWGYPWRPWGMYGMWHDPYWDGYPPPRLLEVALVMRDRHTQKVVYEAHARYDRPWNDPGLLEALFDAALSDFPNPSKPRPVTVPLPSAR